MEAVMTDGKKREIELVVALAVAELDLQFTRELSGLREAVLLLPSKMDEKIKACEAAQCGSRKWFIKTLLTSAGVSIALITLFLKLGGFHGS